jgi:hypothetical protein
MIEWKKIQEEMLCRRNVENLKYLLKKESRAEIYLNNNLNDSYKLFFSKFVPY